MAKKYDRTMIVWSDEDRTGETTFFMEGEEVVGSVDGNDGEWRGEYFDGIMAHFGLDVKYPKKLTKNQEAAYLAYAEKYNMLSEDEDDSDWTGRDGDEEE